MTTGEVIALIKALSGGGGSGGGVLVVTDTEGTLDKTWQEIHDADFAVIHDGDRRHAVESAYQGKGTYYISYFAADAGNVVISSYSATAADGYPTLE